MTKPRVKIISKIATYGKQRWRINPDKSYSVLAFGSFPYDHSLGLRYGWIGVSEEKVPLEVREVLENETV